MTGFIGVGQLKYILTNLGEKMSDEEVDELLKAVDTSSGQVNYTGKLRRPCHVPLVPLGTRLLTDSGPARSRPNHPRQLSGKHGCLFALFSPLELAGATFAFCG